MNTVQLIGRLTRELDLRFTSNGTAVGTFTLAVNRSFTNQQGEREADFIRCVIWRKAAENLANFTRKGSQIGVEGRIQTRSYDNQQGERVYMTEVVVNNFHLLEPKSVTEQRPISDNSNQSNFYNQQPNYNDSYNNFNNSYQAQNNSSNNRNNASSGFDRSYSDNEAPFMEDGKPIDISEDDLPF